MNNVFKRKKKLMEVTQARESIVSNMCQFGQD